MLLVAVFIARGSARTASEYQRRPSASSLRASTAIATRIRAAARGVPCESPIIAQTRPKAATSSKVNFLGRRELTRTGRVVAACAGRHLDLPRDQPVPATLPFGSRDSTDLDVTRYDRAHFAGISARVTIDELSSMRFSVHALQHSEKLVIDIWGVTIVTPTLPMRLILPLHLQ